LRFGEGGGEGGGRKVGSGLGEARCGGGVSGDGAPPQPLPAWQRRGGGGWREGRG
jgi:hypothetical protein